MLRVHQTHKHWLSNNNMNTTQGLNAYLFFLDSVKVSSILYRNNF